MFAHVHTISSRWCNYLALFYHGCIIRSSSAFLRMRTRLVPKQNGSGKRFLSNLKKGGSFQTVLVQEMANTSVSSAHGILAHDTSITKATLAFYLWHLWVRAMNFFLLMQDAREVQVTEVHETVEGPEREQRAPTTC